MERERKRGGLNIFCCKIYLCIVFFSIHEDKKHTHQEKKKNSFLSFIWHKATHMRQAMRKQTHKQLGLPDKLVNHSKALYNDKSDSNWPLPCFSFFYQRGEGPTCFSLTYEGTHVKFIIRQMLKLIKLTTHGLRDEIYPFALW